MKSWQVTLDGSLLVADAAIERVVKTMEIEPGTRYDLPAVFGPSLLAPVGEFDEVESAVIRYRTDRETAANFMPPHFEVSDSPVVTISHSKVRGVPYLAGRDYNFVAVTADALYRHSGETIAAPYHLVIWENDTNPILVGRELQGYAKIFGEIPDLAQNSSGLEFQCSEYGTLLLQGRLTGMKKVEGQALVEIQEQSREHVDLGWKCIPGPQGLDLDYPTRLWSESNIVEAYIGRGEVVFGDPDSSEAPISSRIIAGLRSLPVLEYEPAIHLRGPSRLFRYRTERLS